jgi:glutamate racemase
MLGIFDSGSGGLGVLAEIRKIQPKIDIIYFGDIKNAPYGNRSREELNALTVAAINRLLHEGATNIVSACNSVSGSIVLPMTNGLGVKSFEMIEMVGPTVKRMKDEQGKILLLATQATVDSGIYQNAFNAIGKKIVALPIKDLAEAIEFGASNERIEKIIKEALKNQEPFDCLLLGCTHYPLVKNIFEKITNKIGKNIKIVDPAGMVAEEVSIRMRENGQGKTRFLITKDSAFFRERVKRMFGDIGVKVL